MAKQKYTFASKSIIKNKLSGNMPEGIKARKIRLKTKDYQQLNKCQRKVMIDTDIYAHIYTSNIIN